MISDALDDSDLLRRYLLGKLDEAEADTVERRLLMDDELFELAQAVEDDLLAAAARGDLSAEDRRTILHRLAASPRGQARLAVAEGLNALANGATATKAMRQAAVIPFLRQPPRQAPTFRAAAMAAGILLAASGGVWLALQTAHPGDAAVARGARNEAGEAVRQAARTPAAAPGVPAPAPAPALAVPVPAQEQAAAPAEPPAQRPAQAAPLVFQLALSVTRSAQDHPTLTIPAGTPRVEIQLPLSDGEPFTSYAATVLDAASEAEVWHGDLAPSAAAAGPMVVVSLPADKLPQGSYRIELRGVGGGAEGGEPELVGSPMFDVRTP